MLNKKVLLPIALLTISFFSVWFIFNNKPAAKKFRQTPIQKLRTTAIKPVAQSYTVWVPTFGVIQPKDQSLMIAQVAGQVTSVSDQFRDGAFFEEGDLLLTIDNTDYQAQLTIAEAELKQAEFSYADEQARAKQATKDWYKLGNKAAPPALVSRALQLNSSSSSLQASQAKVKQAQINLERTKIYAPYAGRVLNLNVNVGQVVNNGNTLGEVYAIDSAEIRLPIKPHQLHHIDLPETYRGNTTVSEYKVLEAHFALESAGQQYQWQASINRVEGTIDAQTRQLYVVAEVKDPYGFRPDGSPPIKMGQFINANIKGNELNNVVLLPHSAVYSDNYINVISEGVLKRQAIDPLWKDETHVIIANDFSPQQMIATTPLGDVISGTAVEVVNIDEPNKQANNDQRPSNEAPTTE